MGGQNGYLTLAPDVPLLFRVLVPRIPNVHLLWPLQHDPSLLFVLFFAISLGVVGFMLFGPDSLLTGAGAIEIGTPRTAVAAAGMINGLGAVGSVVQELVVARVYEDSSGDVASVFALLIGASAISVCTLLIVAARNKRGLASL